MIWLMLTMPVLSAASVLPTFSGMIADASASNRSLHVSGALLRQICTSDAPADARQCESYVVGVTDGLQSADSVLELNKRHPIFFCPRRTFSPAEATAIVRSYLAGAGDAEIRSSAGTKIVASAFAERYPCPSLK